MGYVVEIGHLTLLDRRVLQKHSGIKVPKVYPVFFTGDWEDAVSVATLVDMLGCQYLLYEDTSSSKDDIL